MAIPEDAAIAGYVVSPPVFRFPARSGADAGDFYHPDSAGISKNHVSLHGSPLFGHHLTIWTSNGL